MTLKKDFINSILCFTVYYVSLTVCTYLKKKRLSSVCLIVCLFLFVLFSGLKEPFSGLRQDIVYMYMCICIHMHINMSM